MIDVSDLGVIPLFSKTAADDLVRLVQSAADLRLGVGEYAVHEGDERALFVLLTGKIEVTKKIDGIERTIGWRAPGQIFGEVPIVFGTPFQGSYRAAEPSRVMRIEAAQFYTLAAASPETMTQVTALARERIGGLQGIATTPAKSRGTLVGHRSDSECRAIRTFLTRNQIKFDWLTPDASDFAARWRGSALEPSDLPALHCDDGTTLVRACTRDVAEHVGLQTCPRASDYDTVILGGGPAGLAAAVYGASEGLRTIVIEREAPGGQAETSSRIENYLGFPTGVSGDELSRRLLGKGVYYGASKSEASATQGRDIHLIGAGNSAGQAAMFFANHARTVTLVVRGASLEASMSRYLIEQLRGKANIQVALRTELQAVHGDDQLKALDLVDRTSGSVSRHDSGGVFVFIGADAETSWLPDDVARDARGYVLTGEAVVKAGRWREERDPYLLETSVPGVFACGDVRSSPVKRVAAAVGEGSMAIAFIHQFLQHTARAAG